MKRIKTPKTLPKMPHDPRKCAVCRANQKTQLARRDYSEPLPTGTTPRQAPGRHRAAGTAGRHRTPYEGRHREYEGKHRSHHDHRFPI